MNDIKYEVTGLDRAKNNKYVGGEIVWWVDLWGGWEVVWLFFLLIYNIWESKKLNLEIGFVSLA